MQDFVSIHIHMHAFRALIKDVKSWWSVTWNMFQTSNISINLIPFSWVIRCINPPAFYMLSSSHSLGPGPSAVWTAWKWRGWQKKPCRSMVSWRQSWRFDWYLADIWYVIIPLTIGVWTYGLLRSTFYPCRVQVFLLVQKRSSKTQGFSPHKALMFPDAFHARHGLSTWAAQGIGDRKFVVVVVFIPPLFPIFTKRV